MIYLYSYFVIYIALAIIHVFLWVRLQRQLIAIEADLPAEYLYLSTQVVPFTKKESVFWGLRKGRLNKFGPEVTAKVKLITRLQNTLLLMFFGPIILGVLLWFVR